MPEKQSPLMGEVLAKYGEAAKGTLVGLSTQDVCFTCKACKLDEREDTIYRCTLNPPQYAGQVQHHQATVRWEQPRVTLTSTCRSHSWWNNV